MTWFSPRAPKSCWRSSSRPDTRWSSPQRPWSGLTVTWRTNTPTSGRATGSWAQGVSPSVLSVPRFVNPLKQQHVGKMTVESHVFTWENSPTFKLATHWMVLKLFLLQFSQQTEQTARPQLCLSVVSLSLLWLYKHENSPKYSSWLHGVKLHPLHGSSDSGSPVWLMQLRLGLTQSKMLVILIMCFFSQWIIRFTWIVKHHCGSIAIVKLKPVTA